MPSCLVFLFSVMVLEDLCHKISHGFCRLILHLPGGVGVGAEGESSVVMPQHTANGFHVHSVLESQGCESVSEVVEANMLQSCVFQYLFVKLYHRIRVIHSIQRMAALEL